ncbi:MAG: hypothetical protein QOJ83_2758 [Frankiales bacterium]|nr:hypothetical protein [Frankiales bacterium]
MKTLQDTLDGLVDSGLVPRAVALVGQDDCVAVAASGVADNLSGAQMSRDSIRSWSGPPRRLLMTRGQPYIR